MLIALFCLLASLLAPTTISAASVSVVQPLDQQLPRVSRVGQYFSWSFSPYTFSAADGPLHYTTSTLPHWLVFDGDTRTFSGTPSAGDEGYQEITVTAHASGSSTSSKFNLVISSVSPPRLNIPISKQFRENNPSMSSVFYLRNNSALSTSNPSVRIPTRWSFSLGFEGSTFISDNDNLQYYVTLSNGSAIPSFMIWDPRAITLDGVIPPSDRIQQPTVLSFAFYVSDLAGYSADVLFFDIIIADRELSMGAPSLRTVNITSSSPFVLSLSSAADLQGVLVDGEQIQPSNISSVSVQTAEYRNWLRYDEATRRLKGTPEDDPNRSQSVSLPVTITSVFNQAVRTTLNLATIPSFFSASELTAVHLSRGETFTYDLARWFNRERAGGWDSDWAQHDNLTASFVPVKAANWLRFNETSANLTGTVPMDYDDASDHVVVAFTAYSRDTDSTSTATLNLYIAGTGRTNFTASGLTSDSRKRLVLALTVTFGIIGGICLVTGVFAIIRKYTVVEDTAVLGEEGRFAWREKDRSWYGMMLSPNGTRIIDKPATSLPNLGVVSPVAAFRRSPSAPAPPRSAYGQLGVGNRRPTERSQGDSSGGQSSGVMSKKDFVARIRETVRRVSDKCTFGRKTRAPAGPGGGYSPDRPFIGKPILITSSESQMYYTTAGGGVSPRNPFESVPSRAGSTFMTGSPSNSTGEHSIPRRRPDFASPRNLAQVHFVDGRLSRQVSAASLGQSIRSGRSGISGESLNDASAAMGPATKPRLVPFTNAGRVPVPFPGFNNTVGRQFTGQRITSQQAKVCKINSQNGELESMKHSGSNDELIMGIHYVRSLGADQLGVNNGPGGIGVGGAAGGMGAPSAGTMGGGSELVPGFSPSTPAVSNVRSSFTSLESSHAGKKGNGASAEDLVKILVRAGERFKFRVPVPRLVPQPSKPTRGYQVRQASGQVMPNFIQVDMGALHKGVMEFSGLATFKELGETSLGIYAEDGACVVTVVIEVVGKTR